MKRVNAEILWSKHHYINSLGLGAHIYIRELDHYWPADCAPKIKPELGVTKAPFINLCIKKHLILQKYPVSQYREAMVT